MRIAEFKNRFDRQPRALDVEWPTLAKHLTQHSARAAKDGPLWSPTRYREGATRGAANVESVCCFVVDVDDGVSIEELRPRWEHLSYALHSSYSSTVQTPKWRVVFPLVRPVPATEWGGVWQKLSYHLTGRHADASCKDASRIYYWPACPTERFEEAFADTGEGFALDPDDFEPVVPPQRERKSASTREDVRDAQGRPDLSEMVQRALLLISDGRNNAGFWLACQLRDNGFSPVEADGALRDFAARVPQTPTPYEEAEALHSLRIAYSRLPREGWNQKGRPVSTEHLRRDRETQTRDEDEASGLPVIETNGPRLREKAHAALAALVRGNDPPRTFVRGGQLVRIFVDEHERAAVRALDTHALRGILERSANFISSSKKRGRLAVGPPMDVVNDLLALPEWGDLPTLEGLVTAPVVAPCGTICTRPGYLPEVGLYYHEPDPRPIQGMGDEAQARRLLLDALLADFPFIDEASRAHALALVLLPFVRPLIEGPTPLHLVDAPTPGSGKSLLVEAASGIFTPEGAAATPVPGHDDDEWRKSIGAALLDGATHIWLDNITRKVDSGELCNAITAAVWKARILGTSTNATVRVRSVWVGTANNGQLSDEIMRRTVWIRLDPAMERPWERGPETFQQPDLRGWVKEKRPELLGACLTLIREWIDAGRPPWSGRPLGSFESWARVLGGILETAGIPGFLSNREQLYERVDPERERWVDFLAQWHGAHGEKAVGVADIIHLAISCDLAEEDTRGARIAFGRQLQKNVDRVFACYRLTPGGKGSDASNKSATFRVRRLDAKKGDMGDVGDSHKPTRETYLF